MFVNVVKHLDVRFWFEKRRLGFISSCLHRATACEEVDVRNRFHRKTKDVPLHFSRLHLNGRGANMRVDLLWVCLWCLLRPGATGQGQSTAVCSPSCSCDEDGGADCSGRGLTTVPTGLSAFTYYL